MDSSPHQDVVLPDSVERLIERICADKKQPPLKIYARKMLAEIGEAASLEILNTIVYSSTPIKKSFSGFVSAMVQKRYPTQAAAVLSVYNSPQSSPWPPSSASRCVSPHNFCFPVNSSSNLQMTAIQNTSRQLSFEDETQQKRDPSHAKELRQMEDPTTNTVIPQLLVLSKLEYRKLFLVLSYIGRQKLEAVISLDDANGVYSLKDLPMKNFESEIWNKYGHKFCDESDRCQFLGWDSGKTYLYYSYICQNGSYYFKGPYLNSSITHLQRSLFDDNILIVKFEDGACGSGTERIAKEGVFVGLRRYHFFGDNHYS